MELSPVYKVKPVQLLIALAVLLNFSGLFVTIMGPDAALYASVSKNIVLKNNYIELFRDGRDWLDKPHFPFWLTAFSFEIFGFTTWAYKLPGILLMLVGAWYTYLFAKRLYNKTVAQWAVLILLTAQHIVLSDNDVRAEPYLTGLIISSVYHFYRAYTGKRFWQLLLGSFFAGCAIMAKGPFAIIPIGGAIAGELIIKRKWNEFFHLRWLAAAVLIFIFILPELYSLYYQFDLHPEKVVFGKTHVSGLRFFFWDSQFGRFFNNGPIKGEGDPFFFLHTTLWAFLPWSILLYAAIIQFIRKNYRNYQNVEWLTICGSLLTFLVFSASKFQLPHYLNIVFPFFAIITAQYIYSIQDSSTLKKINITQLVMACILIAAPIIVQILFAPEHTSAIAIVLLLVLLVFLLPIQRLNTGLKEKIIYRTVLASVFLNVYLNLVFYPALLKYQSGNEAAWWINDNNPQKFPVFSTTTSYPLEFYLHQPLALIDIEKDSIPRPCIIFIPDKQKADLINRGVKVELVKTFRQFPVTQLDMQFVNHATRNDAVQLMDLAIIYK